MKLKLDQHEQRTFNVLVKNGCTEKQALEILINNVEGDQSQLSSDLLKFAKLIGLI